MQLRPLALEIVSLARKAGDAIMDIYRRESDWNVEQKDDRSPLTLADRRSNEIICAGLTRFPIISEENKVIPYEERKAYPICWMVDPLDGTKEFIQRNGDFTVNIALILENRPVLGVVYIPVSGVAYWGALGLGAHRTDETGARVLQAATFDPAESHPRVVASRSHLNEETQAFIGRLHSPELVSRGSSLKFMLLAEGQAHVYPRLAPTMEWDTAAAQIILEEAGGSVIDAHTQEPMRYNKPDLHNPHFIAYGKR
jgi:3'(2'), 5'-bisphosphate nucleotidase